ncbi:DNA-binding IclR family transcriptional regulator [Microbacterium sp. SORGH_AS 505]|uniref:IclR family transcriptional regulator n=1 Tax=Microbacterium sp. SORGH_AS_0505 TaxID=3041770 RepID=UPI0027833D06|nr:IclR family transcriptional regulator [Microbacterium sp. SORGH_AS_0505]MDQ1127856.1 DNA-binding IclR family transcriptional regulator [Microbacterium sp. SORGH_AS_0505]
MSVIPDKPRASIPDKPQAPAPDRPKVPAADQTLRILSFLAHQRGPVAAQTIATHLELPRSTVYHLLAAMAAHGFVVHLDGDRRWGLGTAAFELAGGYARQEPLARLGRPIVAQLADRAGESAHLAVMTGRDVLYIVEERAPRRPALITDVGVRLPAHLTATGRAMLATLPREQVRALFPDAASLSPQRTGRGPGRPGELRELLRQTRAAGHASEDGEVTLGFRSVGVAVRDHAEWPAAAIAVTWPDDAAADPEHLATLAAEAAAELSRRIGRR